MTVADGGDISILWMTRKLRKDVRIKDHPTKVGFYIENC